MILDTVHYAFHPRAEKGHPLRLTDTTVHPRDAGTPTTTPMMSTLLKSSDTL
jgi:hypothetical protein